MSTRSIALSCWLTAAMIAPAGCDRAESIESVGAQVPTARVERVVLNLGDRAPAFRLHNLSGDPVTLDQYRGVVVMLNFWATWCGPCRVEMPAMEALYKMFPRQDFEILAVSTDAQGIVVTKPFRQEFGLTFPILHDSDFQIGLAYGARTLPMTFLLDRRGMLRQRIFGARDWQSPEAVRLIQTLVQEATS